MMSPSSSRGLSFSYSDQLMSIAFKEAREALQHGEVTTLSGVSDEGHNFILPSFNQVPIGCVFVSSSGEIVAKARNDVNKTKNPTR